MTEAKYIPYQLCPKCNGEGRISGGGLYSATFQTCDVCNGAKIILPFVIEETKPDLTPFLTINPQQAAMDRYKLTGADNMSAFEAGQVSGYADALREINTIINK